MGEANFYYFTCLKELFCVLSKSIEKKKFFSLPLNNTKPAIMLIKVKTLTGKEIEIDIEPTDKVERIKERVEEKEGIPPPQQRLIFSGKQMNDDKTAAEYKVSGGSVLHLVLALRGGCSEL